MRTPGQTAAVAAAFALAVAAVGFVLLLRAGLSLDDPVVGVLETAVTATLLGLLVLWRRPRHRMGVLLLGAGVLFGVTALAAGVLAAEARAAPLAFAWIWLAQAPLVLVWAAIILGLPDGEFGARRRHFLAGGGVVVAVLAVAQYLFAGAGKSPPFPPAEVPSALDGPLALGPAVLFDVGQAVFPALPLLAVAGLVARFRRADRVVRQQLKWVLAAVAATVVVNALSTPLGEGGTVLGVAAGPLPAIGIALAVLRYRLWEIDLLVSRALVYGLLWSALSAAFVAAGIAAGLVAGGSDVAWPIAIALLVALAAQPARARLERRVRRLVYGEEPSGYAVVTRFAEQLAEPGPLAPRISEAARRALATDWAGVWLLVEPTLLQPVGVEGRPLLLTEETVSRLRRGAATPELEEALGTPATVVPLDAGGELVGILACGRALDKPERELLHVLAREGALALRNVRLEAELRRQVEELRLSRRRLVDAQDTERRRIERDLHDGVQQQLVALTARLKRASLAAPAGIQDELREAAADAVESVFALQELARGIYPSLLADQGLVAALCTHASRLPAAVRVEVEPTLAGRRFGRELEAALYFVALEALANAQKHAPGAALTVSLRSAEDGTRLVLEVHDDGPGFDARKAAGGTGLQNMQDRIGAAGGTLTVDSRPGAGTWVRAELPLEAAVIPLQRSGDDSRR